MSRRDEEETQYIPRSGEEPYQDQDFGYTPTRYDQGNYDQRPQQYFPSPEEQYGYDQYDQSSAQPSQSPLGPQSPQQSPSYGESNSGGGKSGFSLGALLGFVLLAILVSGVAFYFVGRSTAPTPEPVRITETQVSTSVATTTVTEEPTEDDSKIELPSIDVPKPPENLDRDGLRQWFDDFLHNQKDPQNDPEAVH